MSVIRHLGIGDILKSAFLSLWIGRLPVIVCLVLWIAAETALNIVTAIHQPGRAVVYQLINWGLIDLLQIRSFTFDALTRMFDLIPTYAARAVFMAALLRIVLMGARSLAGIGFARAALSLFGVNLIWLFLFTVTEWMGNWIYAPTTAWFQSEWLVFMIVLAIAAFYVWLLARFSMIFALCALGKGLRPFAAWKLAKGSALKLSAVAALILILMGLGRGIAEAVFSRHSVPGQLGEYWLAEHAFGEALFPAFSLSILMVIFAVAYTRLSGFAAVGIPGTERTTQQLAETFD